MDEKKLKFELEKELSSYLKSKDLFVHNFFSVMNKFLEIELTEELVKASDNIQFRIINIIELKSILLIISDKSEHGYLSTIIISYGEYSYTIYKNRLLSVFPSKLIEAIPYPDGSIVIVYEDIMADIVRIVSTIIKINKNHLIEVHTQNIYTLR